MFCDFDTQIKKNIFLFLHDKNDHKILNFERFHKTVLYEQLANAHHSTKFQISTSIFDPQKLNFFLQHDA